MRAVKKINNNVVICVDGKGRELVAFGKGIGFPAMPYEIADLSLIDRTFYSIDDRFIPLLTDIPLEVFQVCAQIVDRAHRVLRCNLNSNLIVTLSDHINFTLIRLKKYKQMRICYNYEIAQLYPRETELGKYSVDLIQKKFHVALPKSEITNIAMHFVNAEVECQEPLVSLDEELVIEQVACQVEDFFDVTVDRQSFEYARFAMHMRYWIKRIYNNEQYDDSTVSILNTIREQKPDVINCAVQVSRYIAETLYIECTESELLYLVLHIHRIVKRKDSYVCVSEEQK